MIIQDALEPFRDVAEKIWGSIKYVESSQLTQGKFNEITQQVEINSQKSLKCDVFLLDYFFIFHFKADSVNILFAKVSKKYLSQDG